MPNGQTKELTKCIAVHLPISLIAIVEEYRATKGSSKSTVLIELIETGLIHSK